MQATAFHAAKKVRANGWLVLAAVLSSSIVVLGLSGVSLASKRVLLMDFSGPGHRAIRAALSRGLRKNNAVVPRRQLVNHAVKLGIATVCDEKHMSHLASAVGGEAVICGDLRPLSRRRVRMTLKVYSAKDGKLVRTLRVKVNRKRLNRRVVRRIVDKIEPALAKTWRRDSVRPVAVAAPPREVARPKQDMHHLQQVRPQSQEPPTYNPSASELASYDEGPGDASVATFSEAGTWEESDYENPLAPPRKKKSRGIAAKVRAKAAPSRGERSLHALHLGVGPSFLVRRNYGVYNALTQQDAQGWRTTPVAGLAVTGEIFPGTWSSSRWASIVGVGFSYSRFFGLAWRTAGETTDHTASHQVLSVDLRGRYRFAVGKRGLVLSARAGYRQLTFVMNDEPGNPALVPDVSFSSLDLGLGAELDLVPRYLTLSASGAYLPLLGQGEIATDNEYGAAGGMGLRFGGSMRGSLVGPVGWKLDVDYTRYAVNFLQSPDARRQAEKARDRYLSAAVYLTFFN